MCMCVYAQTKNGKEKHKKYLYLSSGIVDNICILCNVLHFPNLLK